MPDIPSDWQPTAGLLKEKVILVTGACDDIGAAVARACARHGATVILLDRDARALDTVYDEIVRAGGPEPAAAPLDLGAADIANVGALAETIEKEFGRLDGIAHCAQTLGTLTPIAHYKPSTWAQVVHANLHAPFLITQALLPLLMRAGHAAIVLGSAAVARQPRAYWGAYAASLAGLENFARILADELGVGSKVRVHTLDPGAVRTRLRTQAYPAEDRSNLLTPEDVTSAWLYLLGAARESGAWGLPPNV